MNRQELERLLEEQSDQARGGSVWARIDRDKLRSVLNAVFLIMALIGVLVYYFGDTTIGLILVGISLAIKIVEFLVRFLL
ncbi:MAG: hypothetical protein HUK04_02155 [Bacteroidaceae bacterium]|nr:hypothetical protein [Bacteroidaceae bacterium]